MRHLALGPALISKTQQEHLKDELLLHLDKSAVYADAAARALHGDLWWVREPYAQITGKGFLGIKIGYGVGPLMVLPKDIRLSETRGGQVVFTARFHQCTGEYMPRRYSRATLQILTVLNTGWRCRVIMQHIDQVQKALRGGQ